MLLWILKCKFSRGHTFSFLWGIEGEPLNLMVTLRLTFWETDRLFSKATALFYISTSMKSSVLTTNKVIYTFIAGLHTRIAIQLSQTLVNPRRNWKVFLMRKLKAELWVWKYWCFFDLKMSVEPIAEEMNDEKCHVCNSPYSLKH